MRDPCSWNDLKKYRLVGLIDVYNTKKTIDSVLLEGENIKEIRLTAVPGISYKQQLLVHVIKNMESPEIKKLRRYEIIGGVRVGELGLETQKAIVNKMECGKLRKPLDVRILRCDYNRNYCIYLKQPKIKNKKSRA